MLEESAHCNTGQLSAVFLEEGYAAVRSLLMRKKM